MPEVQTSPYPVKDYDVIVIGAGAAGLGCSGVARYLNLSTLLIEKDGAHFGGDCTNYGCIPSKALLHIASLFHQAKAASRFGMQVDGKADMEKVLTYIHQKQKIIRDTEDPDALRRKGIEVVLGVARFVSGEVVAVGTNKYRAKVIFLCTGSRPKMTSIPGMEKMTVYTNESIFFDCDKLPDHFIVIGGGPIGCEMGQAFSRLGSRVTLVNHALHLLPREKPSISIQLEHQFEKEDIRVYNQAEVTAFEDGHAMILCKDGTVHRIPCETVLLAIGRSITTQDLQLDKAGIQLLADGRIKVDAYLQSTNKKVYVIGDAAGTYQFSHGAEKMVKMVWRNLLFPFFRKKNTLEDLSWVTFTDPQVAHFGLCAEDLLAKGSELMAIEEDMDHDDRAIIGEYGYGKLILWLDNRRKTGKKRIRAGSMIAPNAGDLVQEFELAKHADIPIYKINSRVYPYPVASRINQKAIRNLMRKSYSQWKIRLAGWAFRLFN